MAEREVIPEVSRSSVNRNIKGVGVDGRLREMDKLIRGFNIQSLHAIQTAVQDLQFESFVFLQLREAGQV